MYFTKKVGKTDSGIYSCKSPLLLHHLPLLLKAGQQGGEAGGEGGQTQGQVHRGALVVMLVLQLRLGQGRPGAGRPEDGHVVTEDVAGLGGGVCLYLEDLEGRGYLVKGQEGV